MKKTYSLSYIFQIAVWITTSCIVHFSADAQGFNIKTYSTKDGLSSSYIWSINQDKLGYLWLGTPNGVNRFDGKDFINFGVVNGLPDSRAINAFMDSHLRLWISTKRGIVELKGNKAVNYPLSDSMKVRWASLTETKEGQLWALTNSGIYEFRHSQWWKLRLFPGYENKFCRQVVENAKGRYINYGNILVLERPDHSYKIIAPYHSLSYYYLDIQQHGNNLYVSTVKGLCIVRGDHLEKLPGILGGLRGEYVFFYDHKNRYWIGNGEGLSLLNPGDIHHFIRVYKHPVINLISNITEDKDGNIWVADAEGLIKITEARYKIFSSLPVSDSTAIRNVLQPPMGALFVNNGSLNVQEYKNGKFISRKLILTDHSILPNHEMIIDKYAFDDKGRYWYCLRGAALVMQSGHLIYDQTKWLAPFSDQVYDVLFDSYRKKMLFAVWKQNTPCQYDGKGYSLFSFSNSIKVKGNIIALHQCTNQAILFSTDSGAVYSIDKKNNCKLQLDEFNSNGIVVRFCNDPSGDVWIAYWGRGLRRYAWKKDTLLLREAMNTTNGQLSNYVTGLCFDNDENLWVSTNSSIVVFSKKNSQSGTYHIITSFDAADLGTDYGEDAKLTKDAEGHIWLATKQQVICFYPQQITDGPTPVPEVQIENIKLDLEQTNWLKYTDSLCPVFELPKNPTLPYNKNTLGIYFKGISSSGTQGIKYRYMLEGLDTVWSPEYLENFVSYVNLSPGKYLFQVKAQLPNTKWSKPATFSFIIEKPFWETWWFRAAIILIAVSLIVFIFRYRVDQLRKQTEIQSQLKELETKAFRLQMNPHFIHNALNSIQSLVMNNQPNEASIYISKFAKLLRQVLENSEKKFITLDKELYSLQLYVELEKLRMNMQIDYQVHIEEDVIESKTKILPLILQPFVENALWHGLNRKEGDKKITINISNEPGWLLCTITDNGIGRKNAAAFYEAFPEGHLSRAVNIIYHRLADFNQTLSPEPVRFVDLEANGQPAGTSVIICIKAFEVNTITHQ